MKIKKSTHNQGISAIAVIVIAAVVVGGTVLVTGNNNGDDAETATSTNETMTESDTSTIYACADGTEIVADFVTDSTAEITLPTGEVRTVTQTEADSGERFASAEGDFVFSSEADEITVEQNGEAVYEGCVATASSETDATENDTEEDAEVNATTSTETEAGIETGTEIQVEAGADAEATQQY